MDKNSPFEPTVFTALWRYRVLTALVLAASVLLGGFFLASQPSRYQAVATLVVEDPRATALFGSGVVVRPERYVTNQASILQSGLVADRAASIAEADGHVFTPEQISRNLDVAVIGESDEIEVRFEAAEFDRAVAGANSVALAYEQVRLEGASQAFDRAIEELDESLRALRQELNDTSDGIEAVLLSDPSRTLLNEQYAQALARLTELQAAAANASEDDIAGLRASLDDVLQQLQTLESVIAIERTSPGLAALIEEQERLIGRRAELRGRRDGFAIDASLESSGIELFSPAVAATDAGPPSLPTMAATIILGGLVAAVVSYGLAVRNRRFTETSQPEVVIGAPLLAAVPHFKEEGVGELSVFHEPASESAEAFRFVVSVLTRASSAGPSGDPPDKSFVVASAAVGDGKTVVTANLTLASALQGQRVLAVDADFGNQSLTRLLTSLAGGEVVPSSHPRDSSTTVIAMSDTRPIWRASHRGEVREDAGSSRLSDELFGENPGLTDLMEGPSQPQQIGRTLDVEGFPPFDLISRGTASITAPEFFGSGVAKDFLRSVRQEYDVIFIDAPPILQVAYTNLLIEYSDRVIVVVPHRSSVGRMEEVVDRLELLQAQPLGYIYTKAPARADLPRGHGSMADVLGTAR